MSELLDCIKPHVRELKQYSLKPECVRIKINQNENPWDLPQSIKEETLRKVAEYSWSRYPTFSAHSLHEELARFSGWKAAGIIAGNGSNELIQAVLMVTLGPQTRVLINEPTFALYRQISRILGGEVISVPLSPQLTYDIDAIITAINSLAPTVTIICSPNNPTGCLIRREDLISILESSNGLVVVDEAYHEFSGQTVVPLLDDYPNLVVLRTFSKAMAMAGLRIGYLLAAPQLVQQISKAVLPYNLNVISQTAAQIAIERYRTELTRLVGLICTERERLYHGLNEIREITPVRSFANFILARSTVHPRSVFDQLLKREILIRDVSSYPMLSDCFRVSVGTPEENDSLLGALQEIYG